MHSHDVNIQIKPPINTIRFGQVISTPNYSREKQNQIGAFLHFLAVQGGIDLDSV